MDAMRSASNTPIYAQAFFSYANEAYGADQAVHSLWQKDDGWQPAKIERG